MKCAHCKTDFAPGQTVYLSQKVGEADVRACSRMCSKAFDANRRQGEIIPSWQAAIYAVDRVEGVGAAIGNIQASVKKLETTVTVKIVMPAEVSYDRLLTFTGQDVTIQILREVLTPKSSTKKKGKKDATTKRDKAQRTE